MPRLPDHRLALEALDQHAALVVQLEVHRPDHPLAAALAQPRLAAAEQRVEHLLVVLELEEPEHPPAAVVELVEGVVDLGGDPPDHAPAAAREEVLGLAVLEVRVQPPVQEHVALELQRRDPGRPRVQPERERDELRAGRAARAPA